MVTRRSATKKGFQDDRYRALVGALIEQRIALGLSQEAVAERIGLHQQFVSRYELGERRLDAVELVDVARALGLEPAELVRQIRER